MKCQFSGLWLHFWMQWVTVDFDDVFIISLWSDHHISSLYLVWEMTSQFWVQWSRFWMQWVTVVFDDVFFTSLWLDHHISSLYLVMWSCGHLLVCSSVHMFIWSISSSGHLVNMVLWSSGHPVIVSSGHLVIWASDHLVIRLMWSSGQYAHLVNMVIRSCGPLVIRVIWSSVCLVN